MSVDTMRSAIKTNMEAVSGIGSVLDHVVWTDSWEFIYENFRDAAGDRVHVWFIGLGNSPQPILRNGIRERNYIFNLIGYYSLKTSNESSKTFENVVDAILNKFDGQASIGAGLTHIPPTLVAITNTIYVQHAAHTAQIQINILEKTAIDALCN